MIDINLLGKRYTQLEPTISVSDDTLLAVYKIGQPELNRINFLELQGNIEIKNLKDLKSQTIINGSFLKFSTTQNKFVTNLLTSNDIPNLDASKITTGQFSLNRLPDYPISKVTNLQSQLNSKENSFFKGSFFSSTLLIQNGLDRLVGSENLLIDVDVAALVDLVRGSLNFYIEEKFEFTGSYTFTLDRQPTRERITLFHVGTKLGVVLDDSLYSIAGTTLTINTELEVGDVILLEYYFNNPLSPNLENSLQDVTNVGSVTNTTIQHAKAQNELQSATLGQVFDNLNRNPQQTISTTGVLNDLEIDSRTKLLILTGATSITGIAIEQSNRVVLICNQNTVPITVEHESILSEEQFRFNLPNNANLIIQPNEIYSFILVNNRLRRLF